MEIIVNALSHYFFCNANLNSHQINKNLVDNPFWYVKDQKVYKKGFRDYPDKEVGKLKENEDQSLRYFTNRYED